MLFNLTQQQLAHILLPLADITKPEIRRMSENRGLVTAHKPDSQDICFVPDGDYTAFIERITKNKPRPGKFIHQNGQVLGTHQGLIHYTIGQRKGLGIAYEYPLYVIDKDIASNTVILGPNDALFQKALLAENCNLIAIDKLEAPLRVTAKTRYRQKDVPAVIDRWRTVRSKLPLTNRKEPSPRSSRSILRRRLRSRRRYYRRAAEGVRNMKFFLAAIVTAALLAEIIPVWAADPGNAKIKNKDSFCPYRS